MASEACAEAAMPFLTCFWSKEGTQLRRSSPEMFGRCLEPFSSAKRGCAGLAASYATLPYFV
jgi:hypothetical protein